MDLGQSVDKEHERKSAYNRMYQIRSSSSFRGLALAHPTRQFFNHRGGRGNVFGIARFSDQLVN